MTGDLHATYTRLMRWFPRSWRQRNAEAMVGTLMDQADAEGRSSPRPGEAMQLVMAGLLHRLEMSLGHAVLPAVGVLFGVLWGFAEAGRTYPGSSPWHIGATAAALGAALAVARLAPWAALVIAGTVLVTQLAYGAVRFSSTAWPIYLAIVVLCAVFASSHSPRIQRGGIIFAGVSGAVIAVLLTVPLPSIGTAVPTPFPDAVLGYFQDLGPVAPAVVVGVIWVLALAAPWAGWLLGTGYARVRDSLHSIEQKRSRFARRTIAAAAAASALVMVGSGVAIAIPHVGEVDTPTYSVTRVFGAAGAAPGERCTVLFHPTSLVGWRDENINDAVRRASAYLGSINLETIDSVEPSTALPGIEPSKADAMAFLNTVWTMVNDDLADRGFSRSEVHAIQIESRYECRPQ